jgi:SAM-dependent methyltransferase
MAIEQHRHPHFDDNRIVWKDEYADEYKGSGPSPDSHFDLQWKLALEKHDGYQTHPGANTEDEYIADRVYEWTGVRPSDTKLNKGFFDASSGVRVLDHVINPNLIVGKDCIDIGCGMGRWTKTMQKIGAKSVLSADISEHGLKSVAAFNKNVLRVDITELTDKHPELIGKFDFGNIWGVPMATYNPKKTYIKAAKTIKKGGALFTMIYAPEGMHGTQLINLQRKRFHSFKTIEERLNYCDEVFNRKPIWGYYSFIDNIKLINRNLRNLPKGGKVGTLDMLEAWFNWVVPLDTIAEWTKEASFESWTLCNEFEAQKCAYHVLAVNKLN